MSTERYSHLWRNAGGEQGHAAENGWHENDKKSAEACELVIKIILEWSYINEILRKKTLD